MIRKALIFSAIVAASAAGAQESASGDDAQPSGDAAQMVTATMLEEASIVSLEGQYDEGVWQAGDPLTSMIADLTQIGQVENVVLNTAGQMQGLTTDVGGFLGIGTKQVLIPLEDIRLTRPDAESDEITIITRLNEQQLTDLSEFQIGE